jgi:hypothetical protein
LLPDFYSGVTGLSGCLSEGFSLRCLQGIFNSSLDGNATRAIDLLEGDKINESAFKEIIRAAVKLNFQPELISHSVQFCKSWLYSR